MVPAPEAGRGNLFWPRCFVLGVAAVPRALCSVWLLPFGAGVTGGPRQRQVSQQAGLSSVGLCWCLSVGFCGTCELFG